MIESNKQGEAGSSRDQKLSAPDQGREQVMCWKDPTKVCKCDSPQQGVFCVRYPMPTD